MVPYFGTSLKHGIPGEEKGIGSEKSAHMATRKWCLAKSCNLSQSHIAFFSWKRVDSSIWAHGHHGPNGVSTKNTLRQQLLKLQQWVSNSRCPAFGCPSRLDELPALTSHMCNGSFYSFRRTQGMTAQQEP